MTDKCSSSINSKQAVTTTSKFLGDSCPCIHLAAGCKPSITMQPHFQRPITPITAAQYPLHTLVSRDCVRQARALLVVPGTSVSVADSKVADHPNGGKSSSQHVAPNHIRSHQLLTAYHALTRSTSSLVGTTNRAEKQNSQFEQRLPDSHRSPRIMPISERGRFEIQLLASRALDDFAEDGSVV
jgi:hypothetical protein